MSFVLSLNGAGVSATVFMSFNSVICLPFDGVLCQGVVGGEPRSPSHCPCWSLPAPPPAELRLCSW